MNYSKIYSSKVISFAKELFYHQSNEALNEASKYGRILNEEVVMDNLWMIEDDGGLGVAQWEKKCFGSFEDNY